MGRGWLLVASPGIGRSGLETEFQSMFDDCRGLLLDGHALDVLFCYDGTAADPEWKQIPATLERNASEADQWRKGEGSQLTRQICHFLFERKDMDVDGHGRPIMPDENSVVIHDGYYFRAMQRDREPVYVPEDHEGQVIRFRTTQQEAVQ